MCECCGRFIVLLKVMNPAPHHPKFMPCYFKSWEGSPWYRPGIDQRHRSRRWRQKNPAPPPPLDFFDL